MNQCLTLNRTHLGVIYSHNDIWIIKNDTKYDEIKPSLTVNENYLIFDSHPENDGKLKLLKLFTDN